MKYLKGLHFRNLILSQLSCSWRATGIELHIVGSGRRMELEILYNDSS